MSLKLSDLQSAADEAYGNFVVDLEDGTEVAFKPLLRLSKERREAVATLHKDGDWSDPDAVVTNVKEFFRLRAVREADFKKLVKVLGDDLAQWMTLFNLAAKAEEPGEA